MTSFRGDPKHMGLGFSVFVTIIIVEQFGSPLMKSASIFGLAVGCAISGATGYWSRDNIDAAPAVTFLWVHTFKLSVDGALVLPLLIMFICESVSCMPAILATAEISNVDIEGTQFNSRIQGGILCDGLGSLISAFGTGLPSNDPLSLFPLFASFQISHANKFHLFPEDSAPHIHVKTSTNPL